MLLVYIKRLLSLLNSYKRYVKYHYTPRHRMQPILFHILINASGQIIKYSQQN